MAARDPWDGRHHPLPGSSADESKLKSGKNYGSNRARRVAASPPGGRRRWRAKRSAPAQTAGDPYDIQRHAPHEISSQGEVDELCGAITADRGHPIVVFTSAPGGDRPAIDPGRTCASCSSATTVDLAAGRTAAARARGLRWRGEDLVVQSPRLVPPIWLMRRASSSGSARPREVSALLRPDRTVSRRHYRA